MNTRVVLTNRIAMTSATLLAAGAIGVTGLASAASSPDSESPEKCPTMCLAIHKPVTCVMSDGRIRTFGNRCQANVYACEYRLTIVACWPPDVE
jgi:hypothetical protein